MKFAFADPPYLGCGKLYAAHHPQALDWDKPERHDAMREASSRNQLTLTLAGES